MDLLSIRYGSDFYLPSSSPPSLSVPQRGGLKAAPTPSRPPPSAHRAEVQAESLRSHGAVAVRRLFEVQREPRGATSSLPEMGWGPAGLRLRGSGV